MGWHLTRDVEEFHTTAGDYLRARPVEHTVPLTLVDTLRNKDLHSYGPEDPIFGWWRDDDGAVAAAFLQTPPFPVYVTAAPGVPELVDLLADQPLPGVNALTGDAEVFADAWHQRTGATGRPGRRTRLFRLDELTPPTPPPGAARPATVADRDLVLSWSAAFQEEIGESHGHDLTATVDARIADGGLLIWETAGEPVSIAARTPTESRMARVMLVYTPKESRTRGFAGAVTVAVSQAALDSGASDVVLYTDLANPTSNALYQRLGYRPVADRVVIEFTP
jgi:predicted GNAT family acetyltransferase